MIKLIIFDFDGVIIDSVPARLAAYQHTLRQINKNVSKDWINARLANYWGKGSHNELKALLEEKSHLLAKARSAYDDYRDSPEFLKQIKIFNGIGETLEKVSKNYTLAVASGGRRKYINQYIHEFDIDYFQYVMSIDDIKNSADVKPSPYMLKTIMNHFSFLENETIYIGDAKNDTEMAKNAGVKPIAVLSGSLNKPEAEELGVKHIIPDVNHLEEVLERL